jgi:hypothetical protein
LFITKLMKHVLIVIYPSVAVFEVRIIENFNEFNEFNELTKIVKIKKKIGSEV